MYILARFIDHFDCELADGIYLIAPVTWMGWLGPFFVLASVGAAIYCLVPAWRVVRARKL